jgi:hypothetical protein
MTLRQLPSRKRMIIEVESRRLCIAPQSPRFHDGTDGDDAGHEEGGLDGAFPEDLHPAAFAPVRIRGPCFVCPRPRWWSAGFDDLLHIRDHAKRGSRSFCLFGDK